MASVTRPKKTTASAKSGRPKRPPCKIRMKKWFEENGFWPVRLDPQPIMTNSGPIKPDLQLPNGVYVFATGYRYDDESSGAKKAHASIKRQVSHLRDHMGIGVIVVNGSMAQSLKEEPTRDVIEDIQRQFDVSCPIGFQSRVREDLRRDIYREQARRPKQSVKSAGGRRRKPTGRCRSRVVPV